MISGNKEDINDLIAELSYWTERAYAAEASRDYWKRWSETLSKRLDKLENQLFNQIKCPFSE